MNSKINKKNTLPPFAKYIIAGVIAVLVLLVLAATMMTTVPTGHTGIVVTFGKVDDTTLTEGLHFKLPWQDVVVMDNRTQKNSMAVQAFSSDIQQVDVTCSVNYNINSATAFDLYRKVGVNYYTTIMENRIHENVKSVFSNYTADALVSSRNELSVKIYENLKKEMEAHGINITTVSIEDLDFTDKFTDAVESKQVAEQAKLQAQIEQEQKTLEQQAEAERAKILAESNAEVKKIQAEAEAEALRIKSEAEAAANALLSDSITDELIQYMLAEGWNGELPLSMGDGAVSIFDIIAASKGNSDSTGTGGSTPNP